jgi:hypothetical protein
VQVLRHQEELRARVVVVSFATPASLARYRERFDLGGAVLLSDAGRAAYAAFGFGRASAARVWLDPRVWWRYAQLLRRGRRLERLEDDALQLGGDVLTDGAGRVTWMYHSAGPEDRPSVAEILSARRRAPDPSGA